MTLKILENIPETDPLMVPAQRAVIDQIIADHRQMPGATMVILNELQGRIGHISTAMQAYCGARTESADGRGARCGVVLFVLHDAAARPPHD